MKRFGKPLLAIAAAAGAYCPAALAQPRPAPESPDIVVEGRTRDDLKRVCKTTTATGSIIPSRTCKTKVEWEQIRERSLAHLERLKTDQVRDNYIKWLRENMGE